MIRRTMSPVLWALVCGLGLAGIGTGCQSRIGGQTMPSGYYLNDDVQYYRPAPETPLFYTRRALEDYRLNREAAQDGIPDDVDQPPAPNP